jgi:hypothetical protein
MAQTGDPAREGRWSYLLANSVAYYKYRLKFAEVKRS